MKIFNAIVFIGMLVSVTGMADSPPLNLPPGTTIEFKGALYSRGDRTEEMKTPSGRYLNLESSDVTCIFMDSNDRHYPVGNFYTFSDLVFTVTTQSMDNDAGIMKIFGSTAVTNGKLDTSQTTSEGPSGTVLSFPNISEIDCMEDLYLLSNQYFSALVTGAGGTLTFGN